MKVLDKLKTTDNTLQLVILHKKQFKICACLLTLSEVKVIL